MEPTAVRATPGELDLGLAISEGWAACWRNFGPWLGIMFVGGLIAVVSMFTIVGWIVIWPVLGWGVVVFCLKAHSGDAEFADLFAGFSQFGRALGTMLGIGFLLFLAQLPGQALIFAAPFFGDEAGVAVSLIGQLLNMVWSFAIVVRLNFAPFYAVDQDLGAIEAFKASWEGTREVKFMIILFNLVVTMIVFAGLLALLVGVIPASFVAYGAWASAYRQISGTRGAAPTTAY